MTNLDNVCRSMKNSSLPITRFCKIKTYLTIKEKFEFLKEYKELTEAHFSDHKGFERIVATVFLSLLIVKKYTDIELELTYDEYDKLHENKLFTNIVEAIGDDYLMLLSFIQSDSKK